MAEKVLMPQLGESVTEGTISRWLVKVGDKVKKYDPICEVNTDKVNAEVPSTLTGTVTEIIVPEGKTVDVGALICYIASEEASETRESQTDEADMASPEVFGMMKQRYSPAVLQLAQQYQIDLKGITGTGAGGRITRKDVLDFVEKGGTQAVQQVKPVPMVQESKSITPSIPSVVPAAKTVEFPIAAGDQELPVTSVRKTIAARMVQSKHDAPHAWTMVEVDVTNLVQYREQVKDGYRKKEGLNLTFLPFFIKAVVESIKEFPIMNSQWAGDRIVVKKAIHISLAVAANDALYVPVIKDADQKNILGLAKSIDDLVRRTREGRLTLDDMSGGTFTCNNTGSFGSVLSAPIINQPQAAIISMEAIVKRPVVINNMIAIRDMVNLCLSLDHRILDGLVCGRFLQSVKQKLESYGPDMNL